MNQRESEDSQNAAHGEPKKPQHIPVLYREVLDVLSPSAGERMVDGTVGLGGHSATILPRLGSDGFLLGIDRDEEALEKARARLESVGSRFFLFRGLFTQLREALEAAGIDPLGGVDGILLDLGVSSYQLDSASRGFSFSRDGPLDMRMSPGLGVSAAEWLENATAIEIETVLREFGEESAARKMARAIVAERGRRPLTSTRQLAEAIEAVRARGKAKIHPATRVFQAIRIKVNAELDQLRGFLRDVDRYLRPGGRLVVISYHSLEDRIVKQLIQSRVKEGIFETRGRGLIRPGEEEIRDNPRARSARLRWALRNV